FAAFSTSNLQVIKTLGVGLSIAIVLDATVIRMLLLPATMQLMGQWNWYGPSRRATADATLSREPSVR
ncbi:MAG TPA: MMPL family transporter, partial [Thermomicrobiales bacterium]|nr:MMPL family transporter [Thermomicrobiales bacterium]